ncbi:putative ATPase involved in DNA repair [Flavobacteria bacterium BBFL7]|nr:putative ATPase involved in DNA repair [Flavobacteria bacterium BBFL7]
MKGNTWKKWDLHIHTKGTNKNDQFSSETMDDFFHLFFKKAIENQISGIGITDYFSIDNYLKAIEYVNDIENKIDSDGNKLFTQEEISTVREIFIFPNVELRMLPSTGVEKLINIHCLFNPSYVSDLDNDFFGSIENQESFKMNRQGLISYGRSLKPHITDENILYREGLNNYAIDPKSLKTLLDKNNNFKENTITVVSNSNKDGNSGIQKHYDLFEGDEGSLDGVRKTIYKISNAIFSTNSKDIKYFLGKRLDDTEGVTNEQKQEERELVLLERGSFKPCIVGSDAHKEDELFSRYTWIKSETSFDGLKQILFEPEYRVFLGANAPIPPPIRINKISLDFPVDSKFENESFCLSGKNEINLSPNFTCIIGGRGAGKSTILNLIHEKLKPGENQFFSTKKIRDANGNVLSIEDGVEIDNDADEKYIEFLSQNEIEDFAQDTQKLTNAVYGRIIKRDELGLIRNKEEVLKQALIDYKKHIINVRRIETLKTELEQKRKELGTNKKLVESFSSDEYKRINAELKDKGQQLNKLITSKEQYEQLISVLADIQSKYNQAEPNNQYALEIDKIVTEIKSITDATGNSDFSSSIANISTLEVELKAKKDELRQYLSDKGLTEENLKDISNANIQINALESEIQNRTNTIIALQKEIDEFDESKAASASSDYKTEIETQIKSISSILENLNNTSVKPISLNFDFDESAANEKVFTDFKNLFESQLARANYKGDGILKEILFCISPKNITTKEALVDSLTNYTSSSNAKSFLIELFSVESNFNAYRLLTKMTFFNYIDFKKVKVQYDGRPIEKSSFGQRCTAVLVILLLLGNNPIIIDEPEAHLDSLLISNYLVEVIKDRKRSRQIVFATHNANFVVNGDAELIHILSIDETNQSTLIKSTTIENEETRETLIGLEGGFEAFKKRENKYQYRLN